MIPHMTQGLSLNSSPPRKSGVGFPARDTCAFPGRCLGPLSVCLGHAGTATLYKNNYSYPLMPNCLPPMGRG